MIISEQPGDIFDCDAHTVCCPINSSGATMGKGLALEFRERVPGLYRFYLKRYAVVDNGTRREYRLEVFGVPDGRQVLLFPTKIYPRQNSVLGLIDTNLQTLANGYQRLGIKSLALPLIGCGLGNLDWKNQVRPLVFQHLDKIPLPVSIILPR